LTSEAGLPSGSTCVLDTNVLLYAHQRISVDAMTILQRCALGDLIGYIPTTVWEEFCHRLMVIEALASGRITGPNPARKLSERPEVVQELHEYRSVLSALASMGLRFEAVIRKDLLPSALDLQQRFGLLTNDSIIAACALRLGVDVLVSSDGCFATVPGLNLLLVSDLKAS
jgi:predicted nucleic acid-binding protein